MVFELPPHIQDQINAARNAEASRKAVFANLNNADLAASALFWMAHCDKPERFPAGDPVYDSTFWHVIVPEMVRRLQNKL